MAGKYWAERAVRGRSGLGSGGDGVTICPEILCLHTWKPDTDLLRLVNGMYRTEETH